MINAYVEDIRGDRFAVVDSSWDTADFYEITLRLGVDTVGNSKYADMRFLRAFFPTWEGYRL